MKKVWARHYFEFLPCEPDRRKAGRTAAGPFFYTRFGSRFRTIVIALYAVPLSCPATPFERPIPHPGDFFFFFAVWNIKKIKTARSNGHSP